MAPEKRSPRRAGHGGDGQDVRDGLSLPPLRGRCPGVNIVVDDFARDPDIDFPIAPFEVWPTPSDDDEIGDLREHVRMLEAEIGRLRKQPSLPLPAKTGPWRPRLTRETEP